MKKILIALALFTAISCTENQRARKFGGEEVIQLEDNKKLINVTWKGGNIWILTRKMDSSDINQVYYFKEKSSFGMVEGQIKIIEVKHFPKNEN